MSNTIDAGALSNFYTEPNLGICLRSDNKFKEGDNYNNLILAKRSLEIYDINLSDGNDVLLNLPEIYSNYCDCMSYPGSFRFDLLSSVKTNGDKIIIVNNDNHNSSDAGNGKYRRYDEITNRYDSYTLSDVVVCNERDNNYNNGILPPHSYLVSEVITGNSSNKKLAVIGKQYLSKLTYIPDFSNINIYLNPAIQVTDNTIDFASHYYEYSNILHNRKIEIGDYAIFEMPTNSDSTTISKKYSYTDGITEDANGSYRGDGEFYDCIRTYNGRIIIYKDRDFKTDEGDLILVRCIEINHGLGNQTRYENSNIYTVYVALNNLSFLNNLNNN